MPIHAHRMALLTCQFAGAQEVRAVFGEIFAYRSSAARTSVGGLPLSPGSETAAKAEATSMVLIPKQRKTRRTAT